jgi:hypothetical protein
MSHIRENEMMSEQSIDELGLTASEQQQLHRLYNVRVWNLDQAAEHDQFGRADDSRRCRNNAAEIDRQIRALLKHADHRERCSEHHVGDE